MSLPRRRVVVTGAGCVSPIGADAAAFWAACVAGRSGVRILEHAWVDRGELRTWVGAPVTGFDLTQRGFTTRDARTLDPTTRLALGAAGEALERAGLGLDRLDAAETCFRLSSGAVDPARVAVLVGSGVGGLATFETAHEQWMRQGTFRGTGFLKMALPMLIPNAPAAAVSIRFGLQGECSAMATACAAGTMSIGHAFRLISWGLADMAIAGGAEGVLTDHDGLGMAGFNNLRVMTTRNAEPERASRPFDVDRDGFVLGEGSGLLVLESEESAQARGAVRLAEVLGYASTSDAHSMLQPEPGGLMVERAFRLALRDAGLEPEDVDYVNAHATSTLAGDRAEAQVLQRVFGSHQPAVSATKSMTGHCIGASGALEAIATVMSLRDGVLHPTVNLEVVEPGCELDHVMESARASPIEVALSASYGFGGHDAVLVFGRC